MKTNNKQLFLLESHLFSSLMMQCELFPFVINILAAELEPIGICNALTKSNIAVTKH